MTIKDRGRDFQEYADSGVLRRIKIGNTNPDSSVAILADLYATIVPNEANLLVAPNVRIGEVFAVGSGKPYRIYMNISGTNGYMSDWQHQNDSAGVITSYIDFSSGAPAGAANIGDAYNTWTSTAAGAGGLVGDIIIATYKGTSYILLDKSAPHLSASWTSLGSSSTDFATDIETTEGVEIAKALAPKTLRDEISRILSMSTDTLKDGDVIRDSASVNPNRDTGMLVMLGPDGKVDPSLLTIKATDYIGDIDVTGLNTPAMSITHTLKSGDFLTIKFAGVINSAWGILPIGITAEQGDILMWSEARPHETVGKWHLLVQPIDMKPYVKLVGSRMEDGATLDWSKNTKDNSVIIKGNTPANSIIQDIRLEGSEVICGSW